MKLILIVVIMKQTFEMSKIAKITGILTMKWRECLDQMDQMMAISPEGTINRQ